MTFCAPVRGTANKKTTMNWWEYWIGHCWMTGWQSIRHNFRIWADLMGSNYDGYALMREDDPEAECLDWFWASIVEDDVYPKEFIEGLMEMMDRVERGEEKLIPLDEDFFDRMKELTDGVELDD